MKYKWSYSHFGLWKVTNLENGKETNIAAHAFQTTLWQELKLRIG
jgi:hypothetical protein